MYQLFQDSMAICQFCQKPDIFLIMTANPKWPEIQEALLKFKVNTDNEQVEAGGQANKGQEQPEQGQEQAQPQTCTQQSQDRPDIIA